MGRIVKYVVVGVVVLFVAIQLIPYGHDHSNPKVTKDVGWASPAAEKIAHQSCYDCHSNETKWRWYSNIAPASIYIVHDVKEGRASLNFSEWDRAQRAHEIGEVIQEGSMPPRVYTILHPEATLTASERATLLDAVGQLPGGSGERG